jgi:hypothetical protein
LLQRGDREKQVKVRTEKQSRVAATSTPTQASKRNGNQLQQKQGKLTFVGLLLTCMDAWC